MLKRYRLPGLVALGVLMLLAATGSGLTAEEIAAPQVKNVKMTSEDWYAVFLEGKDIGYERVQRGTGEVGETKVFLQESREKCFITIGGKTHTLETSCKYMMKADSYEPMYYKTTTKSAGFDYTAEILVEKDGRNYTVKAAKTLNGKTETHTNKIEAKAPLFFECGALEAYKAEGYLKKGGDAHCCLLDTRFLGSEDGYFRYMGTAEVKSGGKTIKCKKVCLWGRLEFLLREDGTIERVKYADSEMEYRRAGKADALGRKAAITNYKAPDYLKGDTAKFERLGLEITRSSPSQFFSTLPEYSSLLVMDVLNDVMVECSVYTDVPAKLDYSKAMVRIKEWFPASKFGEGKEITTKAGKCLSGKYAWNDEHGVESSQGRYRLYLNEGGIALVIISGRGGVSKEQGKAVSACLDTMKFFKPVLNDRSILTHTDYAYDFEVTRPGLSWNTYYYGPTLLLSHPWTGAYACGEWGEAADPNEVYQKARQYQDTSALRKCKISGHKAIVFRYPEQKDGEALTVTYVYVFLPDKLLTFAVYVAPGRFAEIQEDVDAIVKSIKIIEKKR